ncbi:tyrosine-protein phosphatase [Lapidilactobacillus bayanensis]|uniref:tyrosine-protein phosphatase n=1 Tax=Lapidilactobacillus bayanensis TaxID=2485998 RepID=UPI000F77C6A7|nr:tyrosine-protein phosphatase [Lapidilactobacillus bayanensis]
MAQSSANLNKLGQPERVVALDGTINFRDLGGYPSQNGQITQWRRIYRAASLGNLTASDRTLLADLDVVNDIDLRSPSEQQSYPDQSWDSVRLISNPLYPTTGFNRVLNNHRVRKIFKRRREIPKLSNPVANIYQNVIMTKDSQQGFAETFSVLLSMTPEQATVFHCAAGKDRTGMTAAMILLALNVPDEIITQDYLLTNDLYNYSSDHQTPTNDAVQQSVDQMNTQVGEALYIQGVLTTINDGFGGIANYWREALGLSTGDLKQFQQMFLK